VSECYCNRFVPTYHHTISGNDADNDSDDEFTDPRNVNNTRASRRKAPGTNLTHVSCGTKSGAETSYTTPSDAHPTLSTTERSHPRHFRVKQGQEKHRLGQTTGAAFRTNHAACRGPYHHRSVLPAAAPWADPR
jgi:hypothetical protein